MVVTSCVFVLRYFGNGWEAVIDGSALFQNVFFIHLSDAYTFHFCEIKPRKDGINRNRTSNLRMRVESKTEKLSRKANDGNSGENIRRKTK